MNVLIVGAGRSPNVGDQLIEKVLGLTVKEQVRDVKAIKYYDLSDGEYDINFSHQKINISMIKENKESLEKLYYPRFIKTLFKINWSEKDLVRLVKTTDIIIIGGGHLLIDNFGVFLLNIIKVTRLAKKFNKKVFFWSVGVGKDHSFIWKFLAKFNFSDIPIYTRDNASYLRAKKLGLNAVCSQLDPAFFIDTQDANLISGKLTDNKKLGLFIMDPYEMVRHSNSKYKREDIASWWIELIKYSEQYFDSIDIYNNGSYQDVKFIDMYIANNINSQIVKINERVLSSDELVENIKKPDVILAQRLHAVIPAIALNKRVLALKWDEKLSSILKDIGYDKSLISYELSPKHVVDKLNCIELASIKLSLVDKKDKYINNLIYEFHNNENH